MASSEALHRRLKPDDIVSKIELHRMLNEIAMTKKEDPCTLFEQLSKIENQFNTVIGKEDAIAIILDAAPVEYQSVLNPEQRAKGSNITLQDLAETMDQQWQSMYGKRTTKDLQGDDGNEIALGAINTFRGKCHNCGEEGHKAQDCTKPKKTAGKGFKDKTNKEKGVIIAVKPDTLKTVVGTDLRMRAKGRSGTSLRKAHKTKHLQPCIVEIVGMMVI